MKYFVSNDSGAANIIKHSLVNNTDKEILVLTGPAYTLFGSPKNNISFKSFVSRLQHGDEVITGTGWQTDIEKKAIVVAKNEGCYVSSVVDHWVNYKERFILDNKLNYPNQIFLTNEYAYEMGKKIFPKTVKLCLIENKYESSEVQKIKALNSSEKTILYLCEEISAHNAPTKKYDEFDALRTFIGWCKQQDLTEKKVILRTHPAELEGKYLAFKEDFQSVGIDLTITNSEFSLAQQIAKAEYVIGCNTMPMWIAFRAGKKVLCSIPLGKGSSTIPIPNLNYCHESFEET